jgi:hypothetical protein
MVEAAAGAGEAKEGMQDDQEEEAMKHLWEADHSYYCSERNYFSNECHKELESWSDFVEEEGDADFDMNLVFRWDWRRAGPDWELEHDVLMVFFVGQRKGLFRSVAVRVREEDETDIRAWLYKRYQHLVKLWEPFNLMAPEEKR